MDNLNIIDFFFHNMKVETCFILCSWIFSTLPESKQVLALSATYPNYLSEHLQKYMRNPTFVCLNAMDPALEGECCKSYV